MNPLKSDYFLIETITKKNKKLNFSGIANLSNKPYVDTWKKGGILAKFLKCSEGIIRMMFF